MESSSALLRHLLDSKDISDQVIDSVFSLPALAFSSSKPQQLWKGTEPCVKVVWVDEVSPNATIPNFESSLVNDLTLAPSRTSTS